MEYLKGFWNSTMVFGWKRCIWQRFYKFTVLTLNSGSFRVFTILNRLCNWRHFWLEFRKRKRARFLGDESPSLHYFNSSLWLNNLKFHSCWSSNQLYSLFIWYFNSYYSNICTDSLQNNDSSYVYHLHFVLDFNEEHMHTAGKL
jgi:hypothetical protein